MVADFSGYDYKKYDKIIISVGNFEIFGIAKYQLVLISAAEIDF